jgi:hypothetical protein
MIVVSLAAVQCGSLQPLVGPEASEGSFGVAGPAVAKRVLGLHFSGPTDGSVAQLDRALASGAGWGKPLHRTNAVMLMTMTSKGANRNNRGSHLLRAHLYSVVNPHSRLRVTLQFMAVVGLPLEAIPLPEGNAGARHTSPKSDTHHLNIVEACCRAATMARLNHDHGWTYRRRFVSVSAVIALSHRGRSLLCALVANPGKQTAAWRRQLGVARQAGRITSLCGENRQMSPAGGPLEPTLA